jgi:hypothetical protein
MNAPFRHRVEPRATRKPTRLCTDPAIKRCMRFLRLGPIVRAGNAWKFGLASVGDNVVAQVLADGRAIRDGNTIRLVRD